MEACNQARGIKKHDTKHEVLKACNQAWGIQGMWPSMSIEKHVTNHEMSTACNQAWGSKNISPQAWGVVMHANKHAVPKSMQPKECYLIPFIKWLLTENSDTWPTSPTKQLQGPNTSSHVVSTQLGGISFCPLVEIHVNMQ